MERGDEIAKVSRTLIGMDEEHRERDFKLDSIKNRKPMETSKSRGNVVTRARRPEHVDRVVHSASTGLFLYQILGSVQQWFQSYLSNRL